MLVLLCVFVLCCCVCLRGIFLHLFLRPQRCSRTDKGVHAVANVLAAKLTVSPTFVNDVNAFLPPSVRLFGYRRVVSSFNPKVRCDGRTYEFLVPTFTLASRTIQSEAERKAFRVQKDTLIRCLRLLKIYEGASQVACCLRMRVRVLTPFSFWETHRNASISQFHQHQSVGGERRAAIRAAHGMQPAIHGVRLRVLQGLLFVPRSSLLVHLVI